MNRLAKRPADTAAYTWSSPMGEITIWITPRGIWQLEFPREPRLGAMAEDHPVTLISRAEPATPLAAEAARALAALADVTGDWLAAYFAGRDPGDPPAIDTQGRTAFQCDVWAALRRIPFGRTCTYGQLARAAGRPAAARAVGGAMASNPVPLMTPCHRVLGAASGERQWVGFSGPGGVTLKQWLVQYEQGADAAVSAAPVSAGSAARVG